MITHKLQAILCVGVIFSTLSGCTLSPTKVGMERGKFVSDCDAEPTSNNRLKCAMKDADALRGDYWMEISTRDSVRNGFFAVSTVAGAISALNIIDETFGPADLEHPAAMTAGVLATGFGLNNLFNNPATQNIYRNGAKAILCEQVVVLPYLVSDSTYLRLSAVVYGSNIETTMAAKLADARSAYRTYRGAVARANSNDITEEDKALTDEALRIINDGETALNWGKSFLNIVENDAPNRLTRRVNEIRRDVNAELQTRRPTTQDAQALIAGLPAAITSLRGGFLPQSTAAKGANGNAGIAAGQAKYTDKASPSRSKMAEYIAARIGLEEALKALEARTIDLRGQSEATSANFADLAKSGQCGFEKIAVPIALSISEHDFTASSPSKVDFSVVAGIGPYQSMLSTTDKGIVVTLDAASGNGAIHYDGKNVTGSVVVTISEINRPSSRKGNITVNIVEKAKESTNNNADTKTQSKNRKSISDERVAFMQRVISYNTGLELDINGIYDKKTYDVLKRYVKVELKQNIDPYDGIFNSSDFDYFDKLLLGVKLAREDDQNEYIRRQQDNLSVAEKEKALASLKRYFGSNFDFPITFSKGFLESQEEAIATYQFSMSKHDVSMAITGMLDDRTYARLQKGE